MTRHKSGGPWSAISASTKTNSLYWSWGILHHSIMTSAPQGYFFVRYKEGDRGFHQTKFIDEHQLSTIWGIPMLDIKIYACKEEESYIGETISIIIRILNPFGAILSSLRRRHYRDRFPRASNSSSSRDSLSLSSFPLSLPGVSVSCDAICLLTYSYI